MPKRISTDWFHRKASQSSSAGMTKLTTMAKTGPSPSTETRAREEDEEGIKFFVVGESEVGGEEII